MDQPKDEGLRYDKGKIRWDLLPWDVLKEIAEVYTKGAEKYAPRNWEKGMPWSKCWRPLLSHFYQWMMKKDRDEELGTYHMAMVAWNAMALMAYELRKVGTDDRP